MNTWKYRHQPTTGTVTLYSAGGSEWTMADAIEAARQASQRSGIRSSVWYDPAWRAWRWRLNITVLNATG